MADDAPAVKLDRRVAELVALAKTEQEEVKKGDVTIESLRLETQRLRSSVTRRLEKIQARKTSLDERFKSLTSGLEILRNQREPLIARLRKLDAEEASIQSRLEEGGRIRGELARDAEALNRAQERLKARQQELLASLDSERLRVKRRQADMQRKAAELEQVLHGRVGDIEDELNARRAELETSICDLSAFGVAGGGAGDEAGETCGPTPRIDMSDQVEALGRVEQQAANGASRLDALRKKISALGSTETEMLETPPSGSVDPD
jgi:chromosome segregation ATPase